MIRCPFFPVGAGGRSGDENTPHGTGVGTERARVVKTKRDSMAATTSAAAAAEDIDSSMADPSFSYWHRYSQDDVTVWNDATVCGWRQRFVLLLCLLRNCYCCYSCCYYSCCYYSYSPSGEAKSSSSSWSWPPVIVVVVCRRLVWPPRRQWPGSPRRASPQPRWLVYRRASAAVVAASSVAVVGVVFVLGFVGVSPSDSSCLWLWSEGWCRREPQQSRSRCYHSDEDECY